MRPSLGILDVSHLTYWVEPTSQFAPALGDVTEGVTTMSPLRLTTTPARTGDAVVVEAARARAERRMVKNCMAKGEIFKEEGMRVRGWVEWNGKE